MSIFGMSGLWDWMLDESCTITVPGTTTALNVDAYGIGVDFDGTADVVNTTAACRFETPATGSAAFAWGRETNETTYTLYTRVAVPREARVTRAKDGLVYKPQGPGTEQGVGSGIWSVAVKLEKR